MWSKRPTSTTLDDTMKRNPNDRVQGPGHELKGSGKLKEVTRSLVSLFIRRLQIKKNKINKGTIFLFTFYLFFMI